MDLEDMQYQSMIKERLERLSGLYSILFPRSAGDSLLGSGVLLTYISSQSLTNAYSLRDSVIAEQTTNQPMPKCMKPRCR
jgi:hypothetical protein